MSDLINTLDQSGEYDALAKLKEGEPYFVLIGRDTIAPELIERWADLNRRRAIEEFNADPPRINAETYERECRKSTQAEMIGAEMRAFKRGHRSEQTANPMTGDPINTSYVGAVLPEETKRRDAIQAARARAAFAINSAVAGLHSLGEVIGDGEEGLQIDIAVHELKELSELIQPPRVGFKV